MLLHSTHYFVPVLNSPTNVVGKLVAKHILCYLFAHFFKPPYKDRSYVWFSSSKRLMLCIYCRVTSQIFSIYVSRWSLCVNCWITTVVYVFCVVSCVFCVCRYFSTSIRCCSLMCVRSRPAAVRHSRGSPYRRQLVADSWVVLPFWGQYYQSRWLIQLSIHLIILRRSDPFKFYLKIMLEFAGKSWNISSIRWRQFNQYSLVTGLITLSLINSIVFR